MTPETIYGILGAVSGVLTVITGFIIKLHINRSKCANGMCFDCVCDKEELGELQRVRTEKRKRESMAEAITEEPQVKDNESIYSTLSRPTAGIMHV